MVKAKMMLRQYWPQKPASEQLKCGGRASRDNFSI